MIPFALLHGCWQLPDSCPIEFSLQELSPTGFLFLLPREDFSSDAAAELTLCRFDPETGSMREFRLKDFRLNAQPKAEEDHVLSVSVHCGDTAFKRFSCEFSRSYLDFVEKKLTLDDAEFSQDLLAYPAAAESDFPPDFSVWRKEIFGGLQPDSIWKAAAACISDFALILDRPFLRQSYLNLPEDDFSACWRHLSGLSRHPLAQRPVNTLYIGNEVCSRLFPKLRELEAILRKAATEKRSAVLVFAPLKASETANASETLRFIASLPPALRPKELIINDIGMAELVREILGSDPTLRAGTLMDRRPADPRGNYLPPLPSAGTALNFDPYLAYLKDQFQISRFSADARPGPMPAGPTALHLPFIRSNRSGRCTLKAAVESGFRGKAILTENCPVYCDKNVFLYPRFLRMIGMQNCLYYVDPSILTDGVRLRQILPHTDRLVLQLPMGGDVL